MNGGQARRLCPSAIVVEPRMSAYAEASKAVYRVFDDTSPLVEGLSIDEAFLDVRGMERLAGTPAEIAARLRREPDGELAFLHLLPVERLWGVGSVIAGKLRGQGITTVGDVAVVSEAALVAMLGRGVGRHLHALAHNHDFRPVQTGRRRRSIGSQRALGSSPRSLEEIDAILTGLVDRVTRRMRVGGRVGRTIVLRLRFDDFTWATRSHTLPQPTAHSQSILATARQLLATARPTIERRGLTLIGVAVGNLENDGAVAADAAAGSTQQRRSRCGCRPACTTASAQTR